jgi:hypothetical protein
MREPFAHDSVLQWEAGDGRAPGGAITEELCGSIDHEPPCPLAPHFTSVVRRDDALEVRVLFACDPGDEPQVRTLIDRALARWPVVSSSPGELRDDEKEHAARLATG